MNVELVSDDKALLSMLREIAQEFPAESWAIDVQREVSRRLDLDLLLWDYQPGLQVPEDVAWGSRQFVLVDSRHLDAFRSSYRSAEAGIILKPVTRSVLRALLMQAMSSGTGQLRSDRDAILQCLMHANLLLQQYDAERTNFLGRALHDFHAPLTALNGYCGLLLEENLGLLTEAQRLVLNRMHHSIRRLSRMSHAMFQLSIGRHVVLKPALQEGDMRECAEQAVYEVQPQLEEKNLQLDIDFEPLATPLLFDAGRMEQVMINLLENACKFSSRSTYIAMRGYRCFSERRAKNISYPAVSDRRVRNMRTPNAYRVDIADSGPGIPADHLTSIFEEYVSYTGGHDRSRGGLGLAICRMILEQHQGRIWAENSASGAVFSFILPLAPGNSDRASAEVARPGVPTEPLAAYL